MQLVGLAEKSEVLADKSEVWLKRVSFWLINRKFG
ncbi:Uncharacterised protein [Niallia circulans]|nr:Uncharacterised protein [Niallia circulans]